MTIEQIRQELSDALIELKSKSNFSMPNEQKEFRPAIESMQKGLHKLWLYELAQK